MLDEVFIICFVIYQKLAKHLRKKWATRKGPTKYLPSAVGSQTLSSFPARVETTTAQFLLVSSPKQSSRSPYLQNCIVSLATFSSML